MTTNPRNLTPWQPGQSGNPDGRPPKGYSITEMMRERMNEVDQETGKTYRELLVNRLLKLAIRKGDITAIKLVIQYLDGMPLQRTDITSSGKPVHQLSNETLSMIDAQYEKQDKTISVKENV